LSPDGFKPNIHSISRFANHASLNRQPNYTFLLGIEVDGQKALLQEWWAQ
jgi:hypothetical protein